MRRLSKSKLIAWRQCPKRLWLELNCPKLRDDSGAESAFRIGNEVGEIARRVYDPDGTGALVDVAALGYEEAFRRTDELLGEGAGPVFEAGLRSAAALAFADVMLPLHADGTAAWRMLEVKSSTSVKAYHREDLAIQAYLAVETGVDLNSCGIAHIDSSFVYPGDGDYRGLLHEEDLTEECLSLACEVEGWIAGAQATAARLDEPEIAMGPQCSDPFDCPFAGHCSSNLPRSEYPLSSLPRLNADRREAIEALGITDLREVPERFLTDHQNLVREVTIAGETRFDRDGAAAALTGHGFPAWFLDFETLAMPVPIWKGTRPYEQIPFQFSLHRVGEDGSMGHEYFLDLVEGDPSRPLAEKLLAKMGSQGPVFVYNASFERSVIRQLAARFSDLAGPLLAIADRFVDLHPVATAHFYAPSQHGSWSLKAVLPAACPGLSYDDLEGVADGKMAADAYREAITPATARNRHAEIKSELLEYCRLDTLAMVRLWEKFRGW
jgi:hypothetical protein